MLRIHFANRIETLTALFVERIGASTGGVYDEELVIVPGAAMRRHLTLAVARQQGVCAQLHFDYLARWLWQQIGRVVPGVSDESPFDSGPLAWRIYAAFGDAAFVADHPRLQAYLARADAVMRHELAVRVAGLFDQYTTYRPDWLRAWALGRAIEVDAADTGWQAALWRRLVGELGAQDRAPVQAFAAALRAGLPAGTLPPSAHVFALPDMPPLHLELLQALAHEVEVDVYAINPCQEYWFDVVDPRRLAWLAARGRDAHHEVGHRLLAAWGRQCQSQLARLVEAAGDAVIDDAHFEPHGGHHLLAQVQDSILELADPAPGSLRLAEGDRSIELHVCHSRTREIEVLHDRLLALFAAAGGPGPGDVLVVTPDLEGAAPLIDAVFGTVAPELHIPYAISGRARSRENPAARALLDVLALPGSRWPVTAVLGLLQQPWVARRFGLGDDDQERLHGWLQDAGVHWGLDAAHRAELELPLDARHGLLDGLERLFLGYALPDEAPAPYAGLLPAGDAEGTGALLLGTLWSYADALSELRRATAAPRPAAAWPPLLAETLESFVAAPDSAAEDLREVHDALRELGRTWQRSDLAEPLPLAVVREALTQALDAPGGGGMPTGRVTFASMSSLRNLPFRIVCAIGLDDGAFPSTARPAEFDLMARQPRRGDRQGRIDERNLLLDLLLAAREVLHLSHVGRSVRDNAVLPPSVLVSELLELLVPAIARQNPDAAALAQARAQLVVEHPLQPFAEEAFRIDADPRLRSHHADLAEALRTRAATSMTPPAAPAPTNSGRHEDDEEAPDDDDGDDRTESAAPFFAAPLPPLSAQDHDLPVERLERFLRHPARELLQRRLRLRLRRGDDELQDDEAFVPDNPARLALARRLLPRLLQGASPDEVRALALASPEMPAGAWGRREVEQELADLRAYAERIGPSLREPCLAPEATTLEFEVDGEPWRLHAAWADLRRSGLVRHVAGELRPADRLAAWLQHLMLSAAAPAGVDPVTTWWGRDGALHLQPCTEPREVLADLLRLYARGLREPVAFMPRTAWAYVDHGDTLSSAISCWRPTRQFPWAEGGDADWQLVLRGRPDPLDPAVLGEFHALAHTVYDPLRAASA